MLRWRFWVIVIILAVWWYLGLRINYPPTEEQLLIGLWPVVWTRMFCFGLAVGAFWFWKNILAKFKLEKLYYYFVLVMCLSPTFFGWFWLHPSESVKWFLVSVIFWMSSRWNKKGLILPVIFLLVFSFWQNNDKAKIWENLENKRAVFEVTQKFGREDSLIDKIDQPLWWRRISYNKYSWMLSSNLKEFISFWNLETWFFQEIDPTGQKALIMFYWPEFILAVLGLYYWLKRKDNIKNRLLWSWLILAMSGYLFSKLSDTLRYSLTLPIIAILIAEAWVNITQYKIYFGLFLFFVFYGFQAFGFDLNKRPDYWLDNRPLVYKYFFETTRNIDGHIQVTDRVANALLYCKYFLGRQCKEKFEMTGFNFKDSPPIKDITYAGFEGEFIGPNFENKYEGNIADSLTGSGFEVISVKPIRDNIANQYGFNLVVATYK